MKATQSAPDPASTPALEPGLGLLIDRGILSRGHLDQTGAFAVEVRRAVSRGAVTASQARTIRQMLGVPAQA